MPNNRTGSSISGSNEGSRQKSTSPVRNKGSKSTSMPPLGDGHRATRRPQSAPAKTFSLPGNSGEPAKHKDKDTATAKKNHQRRAPKITLPEATPHSPQKEGEPDVRAGVRLPTPEAIHMDMDTKLERKVVDAVETLTRGQRDNPEWFSWRQNRITASIAHSISHSRFANGHSLTPPVSYLSCILGQGHHVMTRAMHWGVQNEAVAARQYETLKSKQLGRPVRVRECGLFVDPQRCWLAASPDGIVEDSETGERLLLLEIKCPYKHRQNTVAEACKDPTFCLERRAGAGATPNHYQLKVKHSYYTQVQCQMAVVGMHKADFVVFTLKEMATVPVSFDPKFWENTVAKLEYFYKEGVVPRLQEKQSIPALRPEL